MNNTTYKTFKLHPDQKEIVEAALEYVKQKTGTKFDTVALELICQQHMGTGIAFPNAKSALTAEWKKSGDLEAYLNTVMGYLEEITGTKITLAVKFDA